MKQWTVKEMRYILKECGYKKVRTKGDHEIWSNGINTIPITTTKIKSVIANRIVKTLEKDKFSI